MSQENEHQEPINLLDYEKLVIYWCHQCKAPPPVRDSEEYGDGWVGLINAVKSYDPAKINPQSGKPYAFSTYASNGIKHAIWNRQGLRKAAKRGGTGSGVKRYESIGVWSMGHAHSSLFGGSYSGAGDTRNGDLDLADHRSPEASLIDDREQCDGLLSVLSERFQRVVRKCLMEDIPICEVARREGLSHTRIVQILNRSLYLMREAAADLTADNKGKEDNENGLRNSQRIVRVGRHAGPRW